MLVIWQKKGLTIRVQTIRKKLKSSRGRVWTDPLPLVEWGGEQGIRVGVSGSLKSLISGESQEFNYISFLLLPQQITTNFDLYQHKFAISQCCRLEVCCESQCAKVKLSVELCFFLGALGKNPYPCLFLLQEVAHFPWPEMPLSQSQWVLSLSHTSSLWLPLLPPSSLLRIMAITFGLSGKCKILYLF